MPTITVFTWTPDSVGGKLGWDAVWSLSLHFPTRGTQQETVDFSHILTSGNTGAAQTEHAGDTGLLWIHLTIIWAILMHMLPDIKTLTRELAC